MDYKTIKRRERKKKLVEMLGGKCVMCGTTQNLEFDHLNPTEKKFKISDRLDWDENDLRNEASKCQLLCQKCHRIKTTLNLEYGAEAPHGSLWRYRKYKCRCSDCQQANDNYNAKRREVYKLIVLKPS